MQVEKDAFMSQNQLGNKIKVQWIQQQGNDGMPPAGSLLVSGCNIGDHYAVYYKDPKQSWILRPFIAGDKNDEGSIPEARKVFSQNGLQFLIAKENVNVKWKPMQPNFLLPAGAIKCESPGQYGNIYIGKTDRSGVGMVVSRDLQPFSYMTHDGTEEKEGIKILCSM